MKMDQLAFYADTDVQANRIKDQLGLIDAEWIKDTVTAKSEVWPFSTEENVAELQFNYSLGIELEILRYVKGCSWHHQNPLAVKGGFDRKGANLPFISHVGIHLEDNEDFPEMRYCPLVQETFTISHTSEYLTKEGSPGFGRKYHYRIFELSPGSYIKYIRRINPT